MEFVQLSGRLGVLVSLKPRFNSNLSGRIIMESFQLVRSENAS